MNHPNRDEWIPYLFDEANAAERKRLRHHLNECPECAREVTAWRRSLRRLDDWPLPRVPTQATPTFQPVLKWALAACLMVGLGVFVGRLSAPTPISAAELRAEVESSVRASLRSEFNLALEEIQLQNSDALQNLEVRLTDAALASNQQLSRNFLQAFNVARAEDAKLVQTKLFRLEEQFDNRYIALRKDLETFASTADEEFRDARLKLFQLASNSSPSSDEQANP